MNVRLALASTIARHWPFANGSGRFVDVIGRHLRTGTGERRAVTSHGFPMHVFADDLIGRHLIISGRFDYSVAKVLLDRARPNDVLLDVGANIGYVSACFLASCTGGTAICVEPQPGVVDLLRKNMAQFAGRAAVHQVALSDAATELRFHMDTSNRGGSKVSGDGEIVVSAMPASALLAPLNKLDLVKVDVEGHEEAVFRGLAGELERLRPRAILFEDHRHGAAPDGAIGAVLAPIGYRIFGIDKRLLKTALVPISDVTECRFSDYLAVLARPETGS